MRGRATFDWQVQEHESSEQPGAVVEHAVPTRAAALERRLIWLAAAMLALILLYWGGQRLVNRAETNLADVEEGLAEAVVVEQWTAYERQQARWALESTRAPDATRAAVPVGMAQAIEGTTIQDYTLDGDLARVQLFVAAPTEPWHTQPYYVTRVFLDSPAGWTPTAPVSRLWGERRTLETTYFHVEYGQANAAVVAAVAPELDALYLRLYRDLGLVPPRQQRVDLRIDVVGGMNFDVTDLRSSGATIIVPPPELLKRPAEVSLAAALRDAIAFPLAVKVYDEAIDQYIVPCTWHSLSQGIGQWQRWNGHRLPSRRHWAAQRDLQEWLAQNGPPALDDLISVPQDCWQPPPFYDRGLPNVGRYVPRPELAASFISFAVAQASPRVVPELLRALVRHKEWETLAPDVFDMEASALEAAWQAHLAAQLPGD